jgi:hypothetical protein
MHTVFELAMLVRTSWLKVQVLYLYDFHYICSLHVHVMSIMADTKVSKASD